MAHKQIIPRGSAGEGAQTVPSAAMSRRKDGPAPVPDAPLARRAGRDAWRGDVPRRAALWLIRFYQVNLSPMHPPCCRFTPTCSAYAREAVEKYGAARGSVLALRRVLRCNPLHRGGYDPVP